ncbi:MAG: TonB-dependent receptor [Saprospiraceae bacterium]|jgi:outer membrane receptor protein involved in Fe transport|nr:TonB-dependent receptor [Saprospiraceae bacterium]
MKRCILFAFAFFFVATIMIAQRTVTGNVIDSNKEPLIGANIILVGTGTGTLTDENGNFELKDISSLEVLLEFSYTGFSTQTITLREEQSNITVIMEENNFQLLDIVVTANKKSQNIQNVPMAISTISPVQLRRSGAKGFRDYATGIPNLAYGTQGSDGGGRYSNEISIRGISGFNTTAMYLDETPLPESIDPNLIDVAQVEVLKGPQGTLYGSATMAGAIKVTTNRPNPVQQEGAVGVSFSSVKEGDLNYGFNGLINQPISDKVAFRASGYYDFQSGIYDRVVNTDVEIINSETTLTEDFYGDPIDVSADGCPGCSTDKTENVDDKKNYGFNASLGFYPTKNISIIPKIIYQREEGNGYDFAEGDVKSFLQNSNTGIDESFEDKWTHYSLGIEIELGNGKLVSSTSFLDRLYREVEDVSDINTIWWLEYEDESIDAGDAIWADDVERSVGTKMFQQELRYQSGFASKFNFLAGAYFRYSESDWLYLDERPGMSTYLLSDNAFDPDECPDCTWDYDHVMENPNSPWYKYDGLFEDREFALFGELYYDITSKLKATFGFRYFNSFRLKDIEEDGADFGFMPLGLEDENTESAFNPKFNLTYRLSNDQLVYATVVRGFRLGDINENLPSFCQEELDETGTSFPRFFSSDHVWNYELGFKSKWANGRLITNTALFYNKWGNLQQYRFLGCGWGYTSNVGTADTKGFELDVRFKANKNLELTGGVGLLDPVISEGGEFLEAEADDQILYSPKITGNIAANYAKDLNSSTSFYLSVNLQHTGERLGTYAPEEYLDGIYPAYTLMNARVGLQFPNYEISLFGNNLTNTQANFGEIQSFAGNVSGRPRFATNRPITIGLQGRIYF